MAEIYGAFGRVITGNTLGGSIGSLARQILSDKISRIFNAYRDEVQYEGSLLDASAAITRLNELLSMVDPNSEAAKDIKEYIDAIRQEDRKRRANRAINAVDLAGAENKDYPALLKTLKDIMSDPTITETEKEAYKAAFANQTRAYMNNLMKQFNEGGSVTVDGKTVDFGLSANHSQLTDIIGGLMTANPEMRMEIGKAFDQSRAMIMLKAAEFEFANNKDISNNGRAAAYLKLQKATQSAYDLLAKSEFDLANTEMALDLLQSTTKYAEYIKDYKEAAASEYARDYVNKSNKQATSYFDAIDQFAVSALGASRDAITGGVALSELVRAGDVNAIYDYLDMIAGNNGGSTSFTLGGKTYSFSRDSFFKEVKTTGKIYDSLDDFSSGNKNVHPDDQKFFSDRANDYNLLIQGKEIFTIEDKYDSARDLLRRQVRDSGGDIYKIRDAYVKFGQSLSGIASKYGPDSPVYDDLMSESRMFITGDVPEGDQKLTYGITSGNFDLGTKDYEAYLYAPLTAHDMANNSRRDLLETFVSFNGDKITLPRNFAGETLQTEFEGISFTRPTWGVDGIKVRGTTGPDTVHQVLSVQNAAGGEVGWLSFVNGKFVGGTRSGTKYTFYDSATITRNLATLGILSPQDINLAFTDAGAVIRNLGIDLKVGGQQFVADLFELREGTWTDRAEGARGVGSGLEPTEEEYTKIVTDLINTGKVKLSDPAPSYAQQKTIDRVMIKDENGNWQRATAVLDESMTERLLTALTTPVDKPGEDGDYSASSGIRRVGFGTGKGAATVSPTQADQYEQDYMRRRAALGAGGRAGATGTSPLSKPPVNVNRDLGYGEVTPIAPPKPVGGTVGTTPVTPISPVAPIIGTGPIKTTTTVKPVASLTSQALVDFRAGERASATSSSTAVGGFFRNAPFRIQL